MRSCIGKWDACTVHAEWTFFFFHEDLTKVAARLSRVKRDAPSFIHIPWCLVRDRRASPGPETEFLDD